jgi:hypothetical protein
MVQLLVNPSAHFVMTSMRRQPERDFERASLVLPLAVSDDTGLSSDLTQLVPRLQGAPYRYERP